MAVYAIRLTGINEDAKWAYVSEDRYDEISQSKWVGYWGGSTYYASRSSTILGIRKYIKMHNQLLKPPRGLFVDHRDRFGLNNTNSNLRLVTHQQNCMNRGVRQDNQSGYRGVHFDKRSHKWIASVMINGKQKEIGYFDDSVSAAACYDNVAREVYGEFACLNFETTEPLDLSQVIYPKEYPPGLRGRDCPRGYVPLQDGRFAEVDDEDWDRVIQYVWHAWAADYNTWYARARINGQSYYMHRFVLSVHNPDVHIDHINGDGLCNKRTNLRETTNAQNRLNQRRRIDNSSGYIGVYLNGSGTYDFIFKYDNGNRKCGWGFETAEDAARERDKAAIEFGGGFARLNFP